MLSPGLGGWAKELQLLRADTAAAAMQVIQQGFEAGVFKLTQTSCTTCRLPRSTEHPKRARLFKTATAVIQSKNTL